MKFLRIVCLITLMGSLVSNSLHASEDVGAEVRFGDSLMLQQRFREAENVYERLAFIYPSYNDRLFIVQKMFSAATATGDYAFSLKLARAWQKDKAHQVVCVASDTVFQALYQLMNYEAVFREEMPDFCNSEWKDRAQYVRGLSRLWLSQNDEARTAFEGIPDTSPLQEKTQAALSRSKEMQNQPKLSPRLAAGLNAVLPGAGYGYAHRPQTAVACFIVNGLFIWGTYAAVHAKEPGLAVPLAMVSFAWYSGGIMGSYNAAKRENHSRQQRWIEPLELTH